jgi:hypothetical protein
VVIEKRPWPDGEISPWAGEEERPSVLEVARWYPGRAIEAAVGAVVMAMVVGAFLAWGASHAWHALVAGALFGSEEALLVPVFVLMPVFWWHLLDGQIRGWWVTSDEPD